MADALVVVVIPTFGRAGLLQRAVDTVIAQTLSAWELIVVIDGHDPDTIAYLDGIGDPRIRYIVHDRKRGASEARNTGALASDAPWIAFLDDDDEWLPEKLEKQVAIGDASSVVMTLSHVVTPHGSFVRPAPPFDPAKGPLDEWLFNSQGYLRANTSFLQTSSLMVPRALFKTLQFRNTNQHEEWEFVLRSVKTRGYTLRTVPEPLVVHYQGGPRRTQSSDLAWKASMEWAEETGLLTKRAYSGFLLNIVAPTTFNKGDHSGTWPLWRAAFANGSPTGAQVFRFVLARILPAGLLRRVKAGLLGSKPPAGVRVLD